MTMKLRSTSTPGRVAELDARRGGARRLGAAPTRRPAWARRCATPCSTAASALRPLLVLAAAEAVHGDARGGAARRLRGRTDPRLFAGARRPALHGQRRPAPRQADGARAVRRSPGDAGRRRDAGAGLRGADARRRQRRRRRCRRSLCGLLARAAGGAGMAGGQAIDLASVGLPLDEHALRDMHRRKTGALLQASVLMGAACGRADAGASGGAGRLRRRRSAWPSRSSTTSSTSPQASATLGKTAGKDARQQQADLRHRCSASTPRARHADELRRAGAAPRSRAAALADTARAARAGRHASSSATDNDRHPWPHAARHDRRPRRPAPPVARPSCKQLADELRDFVLAERVADRRPPVARTSARSS